MKVHLHRVELPLEHHFTIARGTTRVQQCLIVELSTLPAVPSANHLSAASR